MPYDHDLDLFSDTAARFVEAVEGIGPSEWDRPALGEWNVRELVAHTLRAFTTTDTFLAHPQTRVDVESSGEYYATLMVRPGVDDEVAQRARDGVAGLGDQPAAVVAAQVERTLAGLRSATGTQIGQTAGGGMRLADYLPTRLVELVVHLGDLCSALGVPTGDVTAAESQALSTVLAGGSPANRRRVLRAVLGREALPAGFMIWK